MLKTNCYVLSYDLSQGQPRRYDYLNRIIKQLDINAVKHLETTWEIASELSPREITNYLKDFKAIKDTDNLLVMEIKQKENKIYYLSDYSTDKKIYYLISYDLKTDEQHKKVQKKYKNIERKIKELGGLKLLRTTWIVICNPLVDIESISAEFDPSQHFNENDELLIIGINKPNATNCVLPNLKFSNKLQLTA